MTEPTNQINQLGEKTKEPDEVAALRSAFSETVVEVRDHVSKEFIKQIRSHEPAPGLKRTNSAPGLSRAEGDELPKITIGVCAMDKKARSKQMKAIIERLLRYGEFDVIIFGDDTILNKPVEEWPPCACLLSWHSEGFPLDKAQAYVTLRKPYLVNDVYAQNALLDRRKVYRTLTESGIPVPHHIIVDRDCLQQGQTDPIGFYEHEDYVELDGVKIYKPFVEKPASGEDHNIYIYYPHSMGGGVKRLFRKVDNKSADYDPSHPGTVRREGSFIYEEFLTTGGTDVKVYTVGPRYAHAEARKSPVVDGKVQRTRDGKEVRFPVLLSPQEKEIARMVCLAFGQRVCGFDLLRSERGRSYVCDVNGWSFVKNSQKYYDDTAGILRMIILSAVAPHRLLVAAAPPPAHAPLAGDIASSAVGASAPPGTSASSSSVDMASMTSTAGGIVGIEGTSMLYSRSYDDVRSPLMAGSGGIEDDGLNPDEELRCVLAVIRHGDRTPKQKMKMVVTQPQLLALLHKYLDSKGKQAKLKSPNELQELLDVTRQLLEELEGKQKTAAAAGAVGSGTVGKGNDRHDCGATNAAEGPQGGQKALSLDPEADEIREKFRIVKTVLEQGGQFAGINRKVQLKPLRWSTPQNENETPRCEEALLILKHGGVLTHAGRQQAEALGSLFRNIMYPQHGPAGGGLLRLHSTYRHDLKIYSSDEGRVQTSAAAFTKGLLDLEGAALTPILVSLVQKDAGMLDAFGKGASVDISLAKQELYAQMTYDKSTNKSQFERPAYTPSMVSPPLSPEPTLQLNDRPIDPGTESGLVAVTDAAGLATATIDENSAVSTEVTTSTSPADDSTAAITATGIPVDLEQHRGRTLPSVPPAPVITGAHAGTAAQQSAPSHGGPSSRSASVGSTASYQAASVLPYLGAPGLFIPETEAPRPGASDIPGRPHIYPMPVDCLDRLRTLHELTLGVVDELRQKCLEEARRDEKPKAFSALTQDPSEWSLEEGQPCGGEKLLLLFDRWRKLAKAFYSEKKGFFDISKVPDIYDAAKYDSIHNAHLSLPTMRSVYTEARNLAAAVIPNEYGIQPLGKLRIGSMICAQLLGKLLSDLASMREESIATSGVMQCTEDVHYFGFGNDGMGKPASHEGAGAGGGKNGKSSLSSSSNTTAAAINAGASIAPGAPVPGPGMDGRSDSGASEVQGHEDDARSELAGGEHEEDGDDAVLHRLCPTYAQDVNSPLRHVRTRIYFTSESHCHSLINVLRYCQLGLGSQTESLLSEAGEKILQHTQELDYMTHIVLRMFENKKLPLDHPGRFRVEILFSPGAAHDPYEVIPVRRDHVIPIVPRSAIHAHDGESSGVPLARLEATTKPYAKPFKKVSEPYALKGVTVNSQASELDYWI